MARCFWGAVALTLAAGAARAADGTPLADAVKAFNASAAEHPVGKQQPALTEDEVVAALRGWVRERVEAPDEVYRAFQRIADRRRLPQGASLSVISSWTGFHGYDFEVWWIDLSLRTGPNTFSTFRIRERKLSCRPAERGGRP
jgi:hypothetical protein